MKKNPKKIQRLSDVGEFGLIAEIEKSAPLSKSVIEGIGDDTAVVRGTKTKYILLTTDMMIEGVHFTKNMRPEAIGHKALACNISDVAAMGGKPKYALISLGAPATTKASYIKRLYDGINRLAKQFGVSVVGGDTVHSDKIIINVALSGAVKKQDVVTRRGAKPGDIIMVTGPLGNSFDSGHHLSFTPRLKEAEYLVKNVKLSAMIDVSDGLAADLGHILYKSGVGARLYQNQIPLRKGADVMHALIQGEDFELCFTLSSKQAYKLRNKKNCPFEFIPIGIITAEESFLLVDEKGKSKPITVKGFRHF